MNYVKKFNLLGVEARQKPMLTGHGAPIDGESGTQGVECELYMDLDTGKVYKCVDAPNVWVSVTKEVEDKIGDISTALDELHTYAQTLVNGGAS